MLRRPRRAAQDGGHQHRDSQQDSSETRVGPTYRPEEADGLDPRRDGDGPGALETRHWTHRPDRSRRITR